MSLNSETGDSQGQEGGCAREGAVRRGVMGACSALRVPYCMQQGAPGALTSGRHPGGPAERSECPSV